MTKVENKTFDEERALYGSRGVEVVSCRFDGPADGESALKESRDVAVDNCFFNLRYPFWHDDHLTITNSEMTGLCRAALWYSDDIKIKNSQLHGIKALRECSNVTIEGCDIVSPEFGWSVRGLNISDTTAEGEYVMMRSSDLNFHRFTLNGKYSFQYIQNAVFEDCELNTKDAFWHSVNVTVRNSVIKGEYLAWYADGLTLENCTIIGTQPLCYCKNLKLINCKMVGADFAFEYSDVDADIRSSVISVKNPLSGRIAADEIGEIILGDSVKECDCEIIDRSKR